MKLFEHWGPECSPLLVTPTMPALHDVSTFISGWLVSQMALYSFLFFFFSLIFFCILHCFIIVEILFFKFKFFFFYFTILYWFCHTSTWIHHRYTHVPHPEPPSLLPPHTIPLGHPVHQPQATSIMHRTWTGDSFHIWYYTCFNAILPNHPRLSLSHRVQKTVLYICVSFAVSHTGLSLPSF